MTVGILYVVSTAVIAKVNSRCSVIDDFHSTLKRCLILALSSRRAMAWQSDESYHWMGILPDGGTVHEPILGRLPYFYNAEHTYASPSQGDSLLKQVRR